jgi:hypothetical protein
MAGMGIGVGNAVDGFVDVLVPVADEEAGLISSADGYPIFGEEAVKAKGVWFHVLFNQKRINDY